MNTLLKTGIVTGLMMTCVTVMAYNRPSIATVILNNNTASQVNITTTPDPYTVMKPDPSVLTPKEQQVLFSDSSSYVSAGFTLKISEPGVTGACVIRVTNTDVITQLPPEGFTCQPGSTTASGTAVVDVNSLS